MIDLSFDNGTVEQFTIVLSQRDYTHLGQLSNIRNMKFSGKLNAADEFSFEICKQLDDHEEVLWDDVYDLRLIWIKELDEYFEIRVELTDKVYMTKTITCTSLCECELSQAGLYNIEINTADDIARPDYDVNYPTVFYRILPSPSDPEYTKKKNSSLLHRILDKVPAYSIGHVDSSLVNLQRTFSISNTTVYDFLTGECSNQFNCLFKFDSVNRTVSAYDLYTVCNTCGYRGDYNDVCPECGSTDLKYFGEDTCIFVSTDNLTDEVVFETDVDSIKNAFRLEAGDDNMTAAVINSNPNGSRYIYEFSEEARRDMPTELVEKMDEYDESYYYYNNTYPMTINTNTRTAFNTLVTKYNKATCQVCGYSATTIASNTCPRCGSSNILVKNPPWATVPTSIVGYKNLIPYYYECVDLYSYLKSSMMPEVLIPEATVSGEVAKINTEYSTSSFRLGLSKLTSTTVVATVNNAIVNYAKTLVNTGYVKITVDTDSTNTFIYSGTSSGVASGVWRGRLKVTNFEDDTDFAYTNSFTITCNDAFATFMQQKITKQLSKNDAYAYDVLKLIEHPQTNITFANVIKLYSATRLESFHDAIEAVLGILIDAGQGVSGSTLYTNFYVKYWNALQTCATELNLRNQEINTVWGTYDTNGLSIKDGMIQFISKFVTEIHKHLDFEEFVGEDLYKIYTTYIREDTYSNSNYISDGLDNNQIFDNARQFLERAREELHKSATYQHSIKSNLDNLLAIDEFKPLLNKFELGNWIRIQADDTIYRLRLIAYSIDFDNLQRINTEFSDVTVTANGLNDIQSIIKQASSMASSYGYVEKQAETGSETKTNYIDNWVQNGLNSALIRINNNNDEDISIDETGINARTYDDITESYDPEQLRITHNVIAFTDNNWQSVKTALGKFTMTHHRIVDDNYGGLNTTTAIDTYETYGLVADAVLAGWIVGSHMESSTIIGSHFQNPGNGMYIDLTESTASGREWYIKTDKFRVKKDGTVEVGTSGSAKMSLDTSGNLSVSGKITADSGKIGNWNILATTSTHYIGAGALYYYDSGKILGYDSDTAVISPKGCYMNPGANQKRFGWSSGASASTETFILGIGNNFGVNLNGKLYASDIQASGSITATSGRIGYWNISTSSDTTHGSGNLYYQPSDTTTYPFGGDYTALIAPAGFTITIPGRTRRFGYYNESTSSTTETFELGIGSNFGVDRTGVLYASGADIAGTIRSSDGNIGGWDIDSSGIYKKLADNTYTYIRPGYIHLLYSTGISWRIFQANPTNGYYAVKGADASFYVSNDASRLGVGDSPEHGAWVKISPTGISKSDDSTVPWLPDEYEGSRMDGWHTTGQDGSGYWKIYIDSGLVTNIKYESF